MTYNDASDECRYDVQPCGCYVCEQSELHYCPIHAAAPELLRIVAVDGVEQLEDWAAQLAKYQDRIPLLQSIVAGMHEVANDNRTLLARIENGGS